MKPIKILSCEWGNIETSDGHIYKDAIITPYHSSKWDWKKDNTKHKPGISLKAIKDNMVLVNKLLEFYNVILSTGMEEKLHISKPALNFLKECNVNVIILPSNEAWIYYNKLVNEEKYSTIILLHSTC